MLLFYWTEILLFMLSSPLFCNKVFVLSSNTSLVWLLLSQVLDEQLVGLLKEYILYQHFCWNVIFAVFFFFLHLKGWWHHQSSCSVGFISNSAITKYLDNSISEYECASFCSDNSISEFECAGFCSLLCSSHFFWDACSYL